MPDRSRATNKVPIILGTGNPAKQGMLRWLLEGLPLSPVTPEQLSLEALPDEEEGETHEEIARTKAERWSAAGSALCIATDGGLVVPALGPRWESRFTHRFAGPEATDGDRRRALLELMRPHTGAAREASWLEALAIADRGRVLASWERAGATGVVADHPGHDPEIPGFWFFSLWHFPGVNKTYNQLSEAERAAMDDHWRGLRGLVHRFFHCHFVTPPA